MPHLRLEYSANVHFDGELTSLFSQLHTVLVDIGGIRLENCKTRAYAAEDFLVADGTADEGGRAGAFVHLDVRFMEGRSEELKQEIGAKLLNRLVRFFAPALDTLALQFTVEVRDIDRAAYSKYPEGTLTPQ